MVPGGSPRFLISCFLKSVKSINLGLECGQGQAEALQLEVTGFPGKRMSYADFTDVPSPV